MSGQLQGQLPLLPADPPRWGGPAAITAQPIATSGRPQDKGGPRRDGGGGALHPHPRPPIRPG
ncbi:hypothetical protein ABZX77_48730, partial [Streptomyces sp. NPDC004237]|uniref:hypothetical protein n=1 Tax=Streptomyces sp. NPDC004237 TaxID=3154455 RepID=UPI0033AA4B40